MVLALALLFAVGAQLRPVCDVELEGEALAIGCSPGALRRAERTARLTAEEILRGEAELPTLRRRIRLSFRRPSEDGGLLADALLRATEGIAVRDHVYVGGRPLGYVRDGEALRERLRGFIADTRPTWASGGTLGAELTIRRQYTREGYVTPLGDMLLLITGAAPVFYYDGTGRFARA